jgi:hypothetical protein
MVNREPAIAQKVTPRWIRHIYSTYKKHGKVVIKPVGRRREPIPLEHIRLILNTLC